MWFTNLILFFRCSFSNPSADITDMAAPVSTSMSTCCPCIFPLALMGVVSHFSFLYCILSLCSPPSFSSSPGSFVRAATVEPSVVPVSFPIVQGWVWMLPCSGFLLFPVVVASSSVLEPMLALHSLDSEVSAVVACTMVVDKAVDIAVVDGMIVVSLLVVVCILG